MNKTEKFVADSYKNDGWAVLRAGWPDFLLYKDGPTFEVFAVEVKRMKKDRVGWRQKKIHEVLEKAGIKVKVVWVDPASVPENLEKPSKRLKKKKLSLDLDTELKLRMAAAGHNSVKTGLLDRFPDSKTLEKKMKLWRSMRRVDEADNRGGHIQPINRILE